MYTRVKGTKFFPHARAPCRLQLLFQPHSSRLGKGTGRALVELFGPRMPKNAVNLDFPGLRAFFSEFFRPRHMPFGGHSYTVIAKISPNIKVGIFVSQFKLLNGPQTFKIMHCCPLAATKTALQHVCSEMGQIGTKRHVRWRAQCTIPPLSRGFGAGLRWRSAVPVAPEGGGSGLAAAPLIRKVRDGRPRLLPCRWCTRPSGFTQSPSSSFDLRHLWA